MDTRLLEAEDKPQATALWKEAFDDSDAFISWYFDNKVKAGSSLGLFEKGALVSVLHMIPYTISIQGRHVPTAYIAGAATAKSRQGQGLMKKLLHETLVHLKSRGIAITHLYPFKHEFYEKFGWATYSYVSRQVVKDVAPKKGADVIETKDLSLFKTLYDRMMREYDGFVVRSEREWQWRLDELMIDGGRTAVLLKRGSARAYMLYYENDGTAKVIETVYHDEQDIGALLGYILHQGYKSVDYFIPAQAQHAEKFGMARIVDVNALLTALGAEALIEHIDITDRFAEWNNIKNGNSKSLDTAVLAALLHRGEDRKASEITGRFFTIQRACIFETY